MRHLTSEGAGALAYRLQASGVPEEGGASMVWRGLLVRMPKHLILAGGPFH
jgi:hypothetical protein